MFPGDTSCPMNNYTCRKEHFLEIYKSIKMDQKFRDTNRRKILSSVKAQMSDPPDEPLVILIVVEPNFREHEKFIPLIHSIARLPRGQQLSTIGPIQIETTADIHNFVNQNLSQNKSIIIDKLNNIPPSKVITTLYGLDYNSPNDFKVRLQSGPILGPEM